MRFCITFPAYALIFTTGLISVAVGGSVLVELLDERGNPIEGFSKQDCTPLWGNSVRMPVAWGDNTDVGSLASKPIKIRFIMRDCKLYAFQFR